MKTAQDYQEARKIAATAMDKAGINETMSEDEACDAISDLNLPSGFVALVAMDLWVQWRNESAYVAQCDSAESRHQ